jgi:cadmium resistance protein CadD (predicted permease)
VVLGLHHRQMPYVSATDDRDRAAGTRQLHQVIGVAALTVSNGGDNLAAYTPVFATIIAGATGVTIAVFAAGVAVWCPGVL